MKRALRILLPVLLLASLAVPAWAQHTTVTAQVLDPLGSLYTNCSGSASFIGQNTTPGAGPYLLGGSVFQTSVPIQCDSFARLSVSLADNLLISPSPSQWNFSICAPNNLSNGPPPICFNTLITITGATQDITGALQAAAATLPPLSGGGTGTINGATAGGGLQVTTIGNAVTLGMLTTCTNGQILSWTSATSSWGCFNPTGGSGTITGVITNAGSGLIGGGVSGTLTLSLLTSCTLNQVLQWNGSAWLCSSSPLSWASLTAPGANLNLPLFSGGVAYTSVFTAGDVANGTAWTITDNSSSGDTSTNFHVTTPSTSFHTPFSVAVSQFGTEFNQLAVCNRAQVGIVLMGSALTCASLSTSPQSKLWITNGSATHSSLTLYNSNTNATGIMFRMHNATAAGTGFNFFTACAGALADGSCPSGNVAVLRGDGQLTALNFVGAIGAAPGFTITNTPTSTQVLTATGTATASWQAPSGGGGGTGAQYQTTLYSAVNTLGAFGPGLTGQVALSQGAAAAPVYASEGVPNRQVTSGTTDAILCDSGTATRDRLKTVTYATGSIVTVTVPDATSSGACGSNLTFAILVTTSTTVTVQNTSTSTFTTLDGVTATAGLTTFNLTSGQYATFTSDNTNYIVRKTSGSSGSVTNIATTAPITGGPITTTGTIGISNATTGAVGVIQLANHLGGTGTVPTVIGLQFGATSLLNSATAPSGGSPFLCLVGGVIGGCGGTAAIWSALGNPAGNLTLTMGTNTTTFNQTSNVAWLWANTTTGTVGTTNASPLLELAANAFHGGASTPDTWTMGMSLAAGTDAATTLTFAHVAGSTGVAAVSVPALYVGGTSGPLLTNSTTTLNLGSTNAFVTATGALTVVSCSGCGGFVSPLTTLGDILYENSTPTAARLAAPTGPNNVSQILTSAPVAGVGSAPAWALAGVPVDATNPATLLVTDRASYVKWSSGTALALPAVATNFAFNMPFVIQNIQGTTLTITPNAGASDLIDGSATGTLLNTFAAFVYQDATTAPGHWFTIKFPTFGAFPACADTSGNHLNFTTAAGFTCGTSLAAPYLKRSCEIVIGGTGASNVLQAGDDAIAGGSCYNALLVTETITGVFCLADTGTTTTVTPIIHGGGTILTGALTCGNNVWSSTGTLSGTPTISSLGSVDGAITAVGTAHSVHIAIVYTVPAS